MENQSEARFQKGANSTLGIFRATVNVCEMKSFQCAIFKYLVWCNNNFQVFCQ